MKPPTYHELSIPILNKEVAYTNELLSDHKESWGNMVPLLCLMGGLVEPIRA